VSSGHAKEVVSETSDDRSVFSAKTTSTLNHDTFHDEIARMLPSVQPGLFLKEICNQLNAEHQDLISEKYSSFNSFKTMIHQTLTLMLKQQKVERQSATTQEKGRSHQYIRAGRRGSHRSQSTMSDETRSSELDMAASYSTTSTTSSEAVSNTYNTVPSDTAVPAIPVLAPMEKSSHTEMSVARTAASAKEQTLPHPTVIDSVSPPEIPETQTATYDHRSTHMAPEASGTPVQDSVTGEGEQIQILTSDMIPSSSQRLSPPRSAEARGVQLLTETPEHRSGRQGLSSRVNTHGHQKVSAPGPQGIGKAQVRSPDAECQPPAESSLPLHSGSTDTATTPTAGNGPSTPLSKSCPGQALLTKTLGDRASSLSHKEGQWSDQGEVSHDRSPVSDNLSGTCAKTTTSHPSGSCPENVSVQGRAANLVSGVQIPLTATVAHKQVARGYPARSQRHTTATGGNRKTIPPSDVPKCSKRITSPRSQCQPSFTAINPRQQPEMSRPMPSAGTQTSLISTSRAMHDIASRSAPVNLHHAEAHGTITSKNSRPQARPNVVGTSHSCVQTPKQQSDSSSIAIKQRAVEHPQAKGAQTTLAPEQECKQRSDVAVSEQIQQNLNSSKWVGSGSARSVDEVKKAVTVDLTGDSDKHQETSVSTRAQTNHGDRSALDLGNLVELAREKGKQRQRHADNVKSFGLKQRQAELRLDQLIAEMNHHMENLSGLHRDWEELQEQVERNENKVQAIRQQADRTRDTANRVTLECQSYAESGRRSEKDFANTEKELEELVQELGIL
jgi:hypothetical protein